MAQRTDLQVHPSLGRWATQWDALVDTQPLATPFLRSWWIDNAADGTLAVLAVTDGDTLVGGAAFELDRVGRGPASIERVRCVGQGVLAPDHLDLIAAQGHHLEVARAVTGWLRRPGNRIVDLDGLAERGTLATAFEPFVIDQIPAPFAALPGDSTAYLDARPGRVRSTIKRTGKRLDRAGVVFRSATADDVEAAVDRLGELHDSRWNDDSDFLDGWDRFRAAVIAGAVAGEVEIHELVTDEGRGETIAIEIDLRVGRRLCFYQAGRNTDRDWRGAGSVLRARILDRDAADLDEYDLLRGDEPYKTEWSTGSRSLVRCRFGVGAGAAVLAAHKAKMAIDRAASLRARSPRDELTS